MSLGLQQPDGFRLTLWGGIRLRSSAVRIDAPGWAGSAPLVQVQQVELRARWSDLLRWRQGAPLPLAAVLADRLDAHLQRRADGSANWQRPGAPLPTDTAAAGRRPAGHRPRQRPGPAAARRPAAGGALRHGRPGGARRHRDATRLRRRYQRFAPAADRQPVAGQRTAVPAGPGRAERHVAAGLAPRCTSTARWRHRCSSSTARRSPAVPCPPHCWPWRVGQHLPPPVPPADKPLRRMPTQAAQPDA